MPTLGFIRLTTTDWYLAVAALVLALIATYFYYRRTVPPIPRRIKIPLAALRTIALLALFLALADALWAALRKEENRHDLLVLERNLQSPLSSAHKANDPGTTIVKMLADDRSGCSGSAGDDNVLPL